MKSLDSFQMCSLGLYPTPLYKLENISRKYGKDIRIKRDDLCGVALGGNKVRKLEYLLGEAKAQGADVVFTTGGAQSNHAMLTAACAARLGMKCILILKKRGVTDHRGNIVLDEIYGADVRFMDTDSYDDIYSEMRRVGAELEKEGHRCYYIPCGGSNALGALGYARCVREIRDQSEKAPCAIISATGSGGTTAGLLFGTRLFLPETKLFGVSVDTDPFEDIVPALADEAAGLLETSLKDLGYDGLYPDATSSQFRLFHNWGPGYAIPNAADTPYIHELAREEGILLDPVYTGKAWSGFLQELKKGAFDAYEQIVFVHTGGAAALFAMDLA
jgi:D-cysteine desulfhydrase family pyridoxal phosphate-dependent enzyme